MSLVQLKKELAELRQAVNHRYTGPLIPETPETLKCIEELERATERAKQRLLDKGISEKEYQEQERISFVSDSEVLDAHHNLLRACCNAGNPGGPQIKIKYLFSTELQE